MKIKKKTLVAVAAIVAAITLSQIWVLVRPDLDAQARDAIKVARQAVYADDSAGYLAVRQTLLLQDSMQLFVSSADSLFDAQYRIRQWADLSPNTVAFLRSDSVKPLPLLGDPLANQVLWRELQVKARRDTSKLSSAIERHTRPKCGFRFVEGRQHVDMRQRVVWVQYDTREMVRVGRTAWRKEGREVNARRPVEVITEALHKERFGYRSGRLLVSSLGEPSDSFWVDYDAVVATNYWECPLEQAVRYAPLDVVYQGKEANTRPEDEAGRFVNMPAGTRLECGAYDETRRLMRCRQGDRIYYCDPMTLKIL